MSVEALRLRILHLEDELRDADLVQATLAAEQIEADITRVDTREAFLDGLEQGGWDVILADYQLPSFDGVSAQRLAQDRLPAVPFIFVSGTFGEEIAIERLQAGATDYVLKQRLSRLGPCVRRALQEADDRRQRRYAEAEFRRLNADLELRVAQRTTELQIANAELARQEGRLQAILDNSPAVIYLKDLEGRYVLVNSRFETLFHTTCEAVLGKVDHDLFPPVLAQMYRENDAKVIESGGPLEAEEIAVVDGATRVYSSIKFPLRGAAGEPIALCGISIDITERKAANEEIKIARLEAEQANRAKSEFLSRMSHDLRTPLNAILGFAQLMDSDHLTPDARDSITHIMNAGEHLLCLIDEVLDIARIETGHLALSPEPVSVLEVVRRAVDLIAPLASKRHGTITVDVATSRHLYVLADPQRLSQNQQNHLSNAVKYNRRGGEVGITSRELPDGRTQIRVRDTGPGIPPERLSRLFRPFDRLGAEESGVEGTGLGLTVARELARAMGGNLDLETQDGEGTVFWVELPVANPPAVLEP
ncbi:MAG: ATP-binding protein, partial [bacterium]